jgi:hypothetical protein
MDERSEAFQELSTELGSIESEAGQGLMEELNSIDAPEQPSPTTGLQEGELDTSEMGQPPQEDQQQPAATATITANDEQGKGFLSTLMDMGAGVAAGVGQAVQNTKNAVEDAGFSVLGPIKKFFTGKTDAEIQADIQKAKAANLSLPDYQPETFAGDLSKTVAQTAAGLYLAARVVKNAPVTSGANLIAQGAVAGAIGDFFSFGEHEKRLSNFVHDITKDDKNILSAVSGYLAADDKDSWWEGRLKNVLEGGMIGASVETAFKILGHIKRIPNLLKQGGEKAVADDLANMSDDLGKLNPDGTGKADAFKDDIEEVKQRSNADVLDELITPKQGKAADGGTLIEAGVKRKAKDIPTDAYEVYRQEIYSQLEKGQTLGKPPDKWINSYVLPEEGGSREALDALYNSRKQVMAEFAAKNPQSWTRLQVDAANAFRTDVIEEAAAKGVEPAALMNDLLDKAQGDMVNARLYLDAARDLEVAYASRLSDLANKIRNGVEPEANKELFKRYTDELRGLSPQVQSLKSETGRSLRSLARPVDGQNLIDTIRTFNPGMEVGEENIDELIDKVAMTDNPWQVRKLMGKGTNALIEYFYTNILSGPPTHAVNIATTTVKSIEAPLVKMTGGLLTGNLSYAREGIDTFMSLRRQNLETIKMVGKAAWYGESVIRPGLEKGQHVKGALSSDAIKEQLASLGIDNETHWVGKALDAAGRIYTWPRSALLAEDETFLQLSYRTMADAKYRRAGRAEGLSGTELEAYVNDRLSNMFDEFGVATDPEVLREAVENTFTTDLDNSTIIQKLGGMLVDANEKLPALRIINPFPRVAANLAQETMDHTVLSLFQKRTREAIMAGGDARSKAIGKIALGSTYGAVAMSWKASGFMSGSGPSDFQSRKELEKIGWKPYSFLLWDENSSRYKSIPFSRFAPYAGILGAHADLADVWGHVSDFEYREAAARLAEGLGQSMEDVTFLKGISDFFVMMDDSRGDKIDRAMEFLENRANGFMPWSSLVNSAKNDENMREAYGLIDKLKKRTPQFSEELDPQVNLFGENVLAPSGVKPLELNPALNTLQAAADFIKIGANGFYDDATKEYIRLSTQFDFKLAPLPDKLGEVDLLQFRYQGNDPALKGRTAAYFRRASVKDVEIPELYLRVGGKDKSVAVKGYRDALNQMIKSDLYQQATDDTIIPFALGLNKYAGSKRDVLRAIKSAFDEAATAKLLEHGDEFVAPNGMSLKEAYIQFEKNKAYAKLSPEQKEQSGLSDKDTQIIPVPTRGRQELDINSLIPTQPNQ